MVCASTLSFCFAKRSVLSEAGQVGCVVIILLLRCSSKRLEAEEVGCVPNISYVTWFPNILTNTKFPSNDCTTNYHATLNKPSNRPKLISSSSSMSHSSAIMGHFLLLLTELVMNNRHTWVSVCRGGGGGGLQLNHHNDKIAKMKNQIAWILRCCKLNRVTSG